jgi:hypothetical protein
MGESQMAIDAPKREITVEQYLASKKETALKINPETAEFTWCWGQIMDPYVVDPDLPEEHDCIGRLYFARSPDSDAWVSFYDLPEETAKRLWERIEKGELREPELFEVDT